MNKLSRLLLQSRNQLSKKKLCTKDYVGDLLPVHALIFSAGISTARQNFDAKAKGSIGDRIFAPYNIYKGKAALSVSPILPKFIKLSSGNLVVDRHGVMLMSFVPAISEKKYDREKRQVFALSPTEIGSLISLGPTDSCEFFHDPSMLSSNAGQVRKSLSIKSHGNASGYFISLMVNNNILKTRESFSVPVTTAEFAVMKTACSFALPHIMGWDRLTTKMMLGTGGGTSTIDRRLPDSEWNR